MNKKQKQINKQINKQKTIKNIKTKNTVRPTVKTVLFQTIQFSIQKQIHVKQFNLA